MEDYTRIQSLFKKYAANQHTQAELDEMLRYFQLPEESEKLQTLIDQQLATEPGIDPESQLVKTIADRVEGRVFGRLFPATGNAKARPVRRMRRWLPYAAAILMAATAATWIFYGNQIANRQVDLVKEIGPGGNRATLTLADGRIIDLDEAQTGITVSDEDITYDDGVSSVVMLNTNEASVEMLTLSTPKGGTYHVTLPDGSKVWLNAASTLKYPSRFSGNSREVILEGEAFFDIRKSLANTGGGRIEAQNVALFKVQTAGQTVEVLGTQFNISAYADEAETKTTLVEGKVEVSNLASRVSNLLLPGEQSVLRGATVTTRQVDVNEYTAWRDGWIIFQDKTFDQIMREVERWYDVDIRYEGTVPNEVGFGMTKRTENLSVVLQLLESGGIRFRLDGRALTILNQ